MILDEAVTKAVNECIAEGILAEFLSKNQSEVIRVSVLEYNEELHLKNVYQDGYDDCAAQKDAVIHEKDAVIAEKDIELAEKDNALEKMNARISELEARLSELTNKDS